LTKNKTSSLNHSAYLTPKKSLTKFLQVLELEIKKNGATDVLRQKLLGDTAFKASTLHPFGNLAGRPAAYLAFVKLCNCSVEGAERASLSAKRRF
jgi:hypothetical protein